MWLTKFALKQPTVVTLFFVAVFLGFAMMDTGQYKPNYDPPGTRIMVTSQNGG